MCDPGAIHWIEVAFNDCIITTRDKWSFAIGLISSVVFLVSSVPQIVLNCRAKKVDGQSPFFFSLLFLASTLNLIGVFITKGLITQIIQGIIYCVLDGILFFQFILYKYILKTNNASPSSNSASTQKDFDDVDKEDDDEDEVNNVDGIPTGAFASAALIGEASATNWAAPYKNDQLVGTLFGWVATCIFISSRVPQIMKNAQVRSVGDLSPFYFTLSIAGNFTYCFSVFLRNIASDYLWKQAPFLAGGLGPLACDIIVLAQMAYYKKNKQKSDQENAEDTSGEGEVGRVNEL